MHEAVLTTQRFTLHLIWHLNRDYRMSVCARMLSGVYPQAHTDKRPNGELPAHIHEFLHHSCVSVTESSWEHDLHRAHTRAHTHTSTCQSANLMLFCPSDSLSKFISGLSVFIETSYRECLYQDFANLYKVITTVFCFTNLSLSKFSLSDNLSLALLHTNTQISSGVYHLRAPITVYSVNSPSLYTYITDHCVL